MCILLKYSKTPWTADKQNRYSGREKISACGVQLSPPPAAVQNAHFMLQWEGVAEKLKSFHLWKCSCGSKPLPIFLTPIEG